jgi:hypothetical protein
LFLKVFGKQSWVWTAQFPIWAHTFITVLFASPLVGCHGDRGVGLGFDSREHEILSQVLTGLASARDVLIEEVSGPHSFGIINLIY